jgi:uncharacterized RDD family membrane protein YckC
MGTYIPQRPRRKRSLRDMLLEAEEDHYLDCPNADFLTRSAAFVLDAMFLFLAVTAISRIFHALARPSADDPQSAIMLLIYAVQTAFQALTFYLLEIESLVLFGGTPGKLLTGLRVIDVHSGGKLTFVQAVLREVIGKWVLGSLTLGVGAILPLFRSDHLALHDLVSRSAVKKVHTES